MQSVKGVRVYIAVVTSVVVALAATQMPTYAAPTKPASKEASVKDKLAAQAAALDSDGDKVPDRPDKTSAMRAAQRLGKRVEDLSQRTPTTQAFANANGSWTTKTAAAPVRAQDPESDVWRAIDTSLVESDDGWRPSASLGATTFSDGGTGPLVTMTDVDGRDLSWTWPSRLPKPSAAGSTLTYADVVPNGDLVVTATPSGFSESVILRSAPTEALSLPLLIDTDGAKISKHGNGSISLRSKKARLLTTPTPMMWDSKSKDSKSKDSKKSTAARPIETTLTSNGDRTELVLKPDPEYLSDPSTTYPVTIDPSFNVYPTSITVVPDVDYDWGWGSEQPWTGFDAAWDWNYHTFLDFDSAQLKAGGITSATLALYGLSSETCDPSTVTIRRISSDWSPFGQWNDRPTSTTDGEVTATNPAHSGPSGCAAGGWNTWDITSIAQSWASGTPNYGIEMFDEAGAPFKTYNGPTSPAPGGPPTISVTSNGTPGMPDVPTVSDSQTWDGALYTRTGTPTFSSKAVDADQALMRYTFDVHASANDASPTVSSCSTADVSSGTTSSCVPTTPLANGTYYVRASASDELLTGAPSPWQKFTVNHDQPEPATATCTNPYANGAWISSRPSTTATCTFTSAGAVQLAWSLNGVNQTTLTSNASGLATTSIAIPVAGWIDIKVHGISNAGIAGTAKSLSFGLGSAWITTPMNGAASAGSFTIRASTRGVPSNSTSNAVLQYRVSGTSTVPATGWTTATAVKTSDGTPFTGTSLVSTTSMTSTPDLVWTPAAETNVEAPSLLDVRVVFMLSGDDTSYGSYTSQIVGLQLNDHDATKSGPTAQVGPGSVDLVSGEFRTSAVDVAIDSLAVSRTQLSNAPNATGAAGVFGQGWSAGIATGGAASYKVTDKRAASASFVFQTPEGISYTYQSDKAATTNISGNFTPLGEAVSLGATLNLDASTGLLTYTEQDGTRTVFELYANQWVPTATLGTSDASTTSYYYDQVTGLPTWILAPAPTGVTCAPSNLNPGCAALELKYTQVANSPRITSIDYRAWDPKVSSDGLPTGEAGMTSRTVAKYAYNSNGTLLSVWDPRIADGAAALKTTYEYQLVGGTSPKTRLTSVTAPGQKPWQINYTDGAVATVTRQQDPGVGTGNATWTIRYGIPLNNTAWGLPNMTQSATAAWGQSAADAPVAGAAVFGPSSLWWTYTQLYYWTSQGRLANTASYGKNAWQIDSSRYDQYGNSIWTLSAAGRAKAIFEGGGDAEISANASNKYASWTLYNGSGDRVEAEYGPMISTITDNDAPQTLRSLTQYVFDDEADGSLTAGRPTTGVPDGGFDLAVQTRTSATDETIPGTWAINDSDPTDASIHLYDKKQIRYRYDPVVTGDPNGWKMRQVTQTWVPSPAAVSGWDKTQVRYDSTGRVFQERSPQGQAENDPRQWHNTAYYTVGTNSQRSACGNRAQWAGLMCWEGPDQQPSSGQPIPETSYSGYSIERAPTRTETAAGPVSKVKVDAYDSAGRTVRTATTSSLSADQSMPATTTTYSPTTGLATTVSNGTMTATTGYDSWGRVTSQTDGAGSTSTTTYNWAGQKATVNDGKGTYTYGYGDLTAPTANQEHRGMPTTVNSGVSGAAVSLSGVYDEWGNLETQYISTGGNPPNVATSQSYNLAGDLTTRLYWASWGNTMTDLAYSTQVMNVDGRVRSVNENGRVVTYKYDERGRLVQALDSWAGAPTPCRKRSYGLTPDSDRVSMTSATYASCSNTSGSPTSSSTTASTYDAAHRITNTGYAYDDLGRTTTLPAAATENPASGAVTAAYYADDTVRSLAQAGAKQTHTLDSFGRISTTSTETGGVVLKKATNHYSDSSDSPAWTEIQTRPNSATEWTATWTRYVMGLDGAVAMTQTGSAAPEVSVHNAHGDTYSSISLGTYYFGAFSSYTEFGMTRDGVASTARYGWHGRAQRDSDGLGGITLMGTRLYAPATGRFLSRDSVQGGNDNAYIYPADPINKMDLDGRMWGWVFRAAMKGIGFGLGTLCLTSTVGYYACRAAVGGAVSALTYIGWQKYVKHDSINWETAIASFLYGAIGSLPGSGLVATSVVASLKYWGGRVVAAAYSKLLSVGWNAVAGVVYSLWNSVYNALSSRRFFR